MRQVIKADFTGNAKIEIETPDNEVYTHEKILELLSVLEDCLEKECRDYSFFEIPNLENK